MIVKAKMAMVISPKSKVVTLILLISVITLVALIITGVISIWNKDEEKPSSPGIRTVSSRLQQFTGYTATKHVSWVSIDYNYDTVPNTSSASVQLPACYASLFRTTFIVKYPRYVESRELRYVYIFIFNRIN